MRVLIVVVASVIGSVQTAKKPPQTPHAQITIALPAGHGFTNAARHLVTLSPDGTRTARVGNGERPSGW